MQVIVKIQDTGYYQNNENKRTFFESFSKRNQLKNDK